MLWLSAAIFALTYLGLAIGGVPGLRMDRAAIAFVGAALMLALGILSVRDAFAADSIDYETLLLLFGMMVVVGCLRLSGAFAWLTGVSLSRLRTPRGLLAATIVLAGVLSAFLVNDVVCVALTPLVLHLAKRLRFDPVPHLVGIATAANIGSCATITGNPQNMIIGMQSHLSYLAFASHLLPVACAGLLVDFGLISLVYRRTLADRGAGAWAAASASPGEGAAVPVGPGDPGAENGAADDGALAGRAQRWLRGKSALVALVAIGLFCLGWPVALVAMGAAAFLLVGRVASARVYREVDWSLLLMFAGLFIVVRAFQVHVVSHWGIDHWSWLQGDPVARLSVAAAALSNLVSNVPAVLLFEPLIRGLAPAAQPNGWLVLSMASTLAGNLTLLGSVANLIVVESARRDGVKLSFWEYAKVGVPVTVLTLGGGMAWLEWVHY